MSAVAARPRRSSDLVVAVALVGGAVAVSLVAAAWAFMPVLATLGLAGLAVAVVSVVRPDFATLSVIAILYSNAAVVGVRFHDVPYAVGASVPLLLVAPLVYHLIARRRPFLITPGLPWVLLFCLALIVSTLLSSDPRLSTRDFAVFVVEGLGLYVLVVNIVRSTRMLRRVVWVLLGVGGVLGAISVYQYVGHADHTGFFGFGQITGGVGREENALGIDVEQPRIGGPIGEENRFAQVLLVLVPLGVFAYLEARSLVERSLAAAATVLVGAGVVLTFSRGAIVAFGLLLVAMVALRTIPIRYAAVLAAGFAVALLAVPEFRARVATLEGVFSAASDAGLQGADTSIRSRATENLAAALMFVDRPVTGVGLGRYPDFYLEYGERVDIRLRNEQRQPHSLYLQIAAELGVLGLVSLGGFVLVTFFSLLRARRVLAATRPDLSALCTAFALAIVAYLATALFLHLSYIRYFWLLFGLAGVASVLALDEASESESRPPARSRRAAASAH